MDAKKAVNEKIPGKTAVVLQTSSPRKVGLFPGPGAVVTNS